MTRPTKSFCQSSAMPDTPTAHGIPQPILDALADADPRLAEIGRMMFRLERIEQDIRQMYERYAGETTYLYRVEVRRDLKEILEGKP